MGESTPSAATAVRRILSYVMLSLVAIVMVAPFAWMLITSLTPSSELFRYPPGLPSALRFENYTEVFDRFPFGRFSFNSFFIAVVATVGTVLSSSLAAYAFARMRFRGSTSLYWIVLATMMVPFQVTMVPVFFVIKSLGWIDSHASLTVPAYFGFGMGAFGVFMLRQFFSTVPRELEEAAVLDGASRFRIYWQIMMPLALPALATLSVITFMASWNDLLGPVLYLSSREKMTLTVGIAALQGGELAARIDLIMAGAVVSIVPILVLYVIAQRYFISGIGAGGVKG